MVSIRSPWVNYLGGVVGALVFIWGLWSLSEAFTLPGAIWAVLGFLILGWAFLDRRKFSRGTPESEMDGGRTIE
jgi:hypothetical protein